MALNKLVEKAKILSEALPYMKRFAGKTFVIKYGGHAMVDEALKQGFARDVILLKQVGIHPVVVHGGGPQIGETMKQMGLQPQFVDGFRVTDKATVNVVEMVLAGLVNKEIVSLINLQGGRAAGISGKDGHTIIARKLTRQRRNVDSDVPEIIDLGWVGEVEHIDTTLLELFNKSDVIPVVAPVGVGKKGETFNINADLVAGRVAEAMKAEKLVLLTDVEGVKDGQGKLLSHIRVGEIPGLVASGVVTGGMIPKLESCAHTCRQGVNAVHIIDGRVQHALLLEIFTDEGVGTIIQP